MLTQHLTARAVCTIRHERAYDFDVSRGVWLRRLVAEEQIHNILTNPGRVAIHTFVYGTAAQRTTANLGANGLSYIGLSNNGSAPAASDSALAAELSGSGLSRAAGTVTLPTGAGTLTTISHTFTYSGVPTQDVQKAALFDAATGGNMAHEILFTARTLVTNDNLTLTFQITLT